MLQGTDIILPSLFLQYSSYRGRVATRKRIKREEIMSDRTDKEKEGGDKQRRQMR
jgi:hypothetical protein